MSLLITSRDDSLRARHTDATPTVRIVLLWRRSSLLGSHSGNRFQEWFRFSCFHLALSWRCWDDAQLIFQRRRYGKWLDTFTIHIMNAKDSPKLYEARARLYPSRSSQADLFFSIFRDLQVLRTFGFRFLHRSKLNVLGSFGRILFLHIFQRFSQFSVKLKPCANLVNWCVCGWCVWGVLNIHNPKIEPIY